VTTGPYAARDRPVAVTDVAPYSGAMAEQDVDPAELDVMDIFETSTGSSLVCRVCGSLVAESGDYPRAHFDWHEAANGA
jgi:hypothetical protein